MTRTIRNMPLLFVCAIAFVTYLMLLPHPPKLNDFEYMDKVEHATVFSGLTLMGIIAFIKKTNLICVGLIAYGGLMEILQGTLTTTRTASWADLLADCVGVFFGYLLFNYIKNCKL